MRIIPLILLMAISLLKLQANTYYISNSGNDNHTTEEAQNPATPWKTITKLNAMAYSLKAGDVILFKRGEVFDGPLILNRSGSLGLPIVFSAYGSGARPVINGLTSLYNWASAGNGIWESDCYANAMVNTVLVNGEVKPIGRYPNLDAPGKGYLSIESTSGNTRITDNELPSFPDWTGGEVVIRKARWVLDRNLITRHSGTSIEYISESHWHPAAKFGYFIQNHAKTLDIAGEWYYHLNAKKLGIYLPTGSPSSSFIQASTVNVLASLNDLSNIVFENLGFYGANINAFEMNNARHIRISNCEILYSGVNAFRAKNASDITVQNSVIDYTNNVACNFEECSNITISNNKIRNTGMIAGMGKGDSGSYEAILIDGDNELIEGNEIINTGYTAITFRGNVNTIKNNYINNFATVKDDAAGIYTWNNIPNIPLTYGSKLIGNIILNGIGAAAGTEWPDYYPASGIYIDDNTANLEITGNTMANCALYGMYIHNAHELAVHNNTLFNSNSQLAMTQDEHATYSAIRNVSLLNNILVGANSYQKVIELRSPNNDIAQFGTFDFNYYARPTYDILTVYAKYAVNGNYVEKDYNLDEWKALFGKDQNSRKSPVQLLSSDDIRFEYNGTFSVKNVPLDGNFVDVYNTSYAGSVTLQPFTSVVLMRQGSAVDNTPGCPGAGSILYEQWDNVSGNDIASIPLDRTPTSNRQQPWLETFRSGDNYGSRMRGFICPPVSGEYTFMISGDDAGELFLSTDEDPANKKKIASFLNWTNSREFTKFPSQKSAKINLETGRRYYIEVLQKEGDGNDHVTVAWQLPDGTAEIPIPGKRLAPYTSGPGKTDQSISFGTLSDKMYGDPPFGLSASASSGLPVIFRVVSGPATISGNTVTLNGSGRVMIEASQGGDATYNPAIATQSFTVTTSDPTPPVGCSGTGSILLEQWNNVEGSNVNQIPLAITPDISVQINKLETSPDTRDNFGERIRGYICPPLTGNYTFLVSGDDAVELWLGTSDNPGGKQLIAGVPGHTAFHEWNKYPSQRSAPVSLQAGTRYCIEVLHKEGWGQDHVSVGWEMPNGASEVPIPGNRLSSYTSVPPSQVCSGTGGILHELWNNVGGNDVNQIPLTSTPDMSVQINRLETSPDTHDNFGERLRGYICPPLTGNYTFLVSGDDAVELWLSTSDNPGGKRLIAGVPGHTAFHEWNKYPSQRSAPVSLQAGTRYYIEVLHKEGWGQDHVSVGWEMPNGATEIPIPGGSLSPFNINQFVSAAKIAADKEQLTEKVHVQNAALNVFPNPFRSSSTILYTPAESGGLRLDLYDLNGRRVQKLFDGMVKSGVQGKVLLKADGLSHGIYFIHMVSKSTVNIQKVTLIR